MLMELLRELLLFVGYVGNGNTFPDPLSSEEERLWLQKLHDGTSEERAEARDVLITHNLRLVAHIAKKYLRTGRDNDDVISIGTIGLIKAVSTFDAGKGSALSSYASRCIENEILMSIRLEKRQVNEVSLSDPIGEDSEGNSLSIAELLGTDPDMIFDTVRRRIDTETVYAAMKRTLTDREFMVVRMRYGLFGAHRLSQREVANMLGISRSYISRIEKKALSKLNAALEKG